MRQEVDLDTGTLVADLTKMLENPDVWKMMSTQADALAVRDAASKICDEISVDVITQKSI